MARQMAMSMTIPIPRCISSIELPGISSQVTRTSATGNRSRRARYSSSTPKPHLPVPAGSDGAQWVVVCVCVFCVRVRFLCACAFFVCVCVFCVRVCWDGGGDQNSRHLAVDTQEGCREARLQSGGSRAHGGRSAAAGMSSRGGGAEGPGAYRSTCWLWKRTRAAPREKSLKPHCVSAMFRRTVPPPGTSSVA